MATNISWTDETWNPIVGCSKVSPGCQHCYAERMAVRIIAMGGPPAHLYHDVIREHRWNGLAVEAGLRTLERPLSWRKPRKIFVCSMSDLFHESLEDSQIDRVWAVMGLCGFGRRLGSLRRLGALDGKLCSGPTGPSCHVFQVLTKRPERMAAYVNDPACRERIANLADAFAGPHDGYGHGMIMQQGWPFRHVWCGTSVEDEERAAKRIPHLLATPAAVKWVSFEPLLDAVRGQWVSRLDWLVVGGESGPGARPMRREWVDELLRGAQGSCVPFFFKQWGAVVGHGGDRIDGFLWQQFPDDPASLVGTREG